MTTPIEDITNVCEEHHINIDTDKYKENLFDFSLPQKDRIASLDRYYKEDPDNIHEVMSKLMSIYNLTNLSVIKKFLSEFILHSTIPLILRLDCCITLTYNESSKTTGYELLESLCDRFDTTIPTTQQISSILHLLNSSLHNEKALHFLYKLLKNQSIEPSIRYKTILGLEKNVKENGKDISIEAALHFIRNEENPIRFRILSGQYILTNNVNIGEVESILLSLTKNQTLSNNTRADAADVLLHLGTDKSVREAEKIIIALGGQAFHIFDNQQNVHTFEVEKSVEELMQFLDTCNLNPIPTFNTTCYNIKELALKRYRKSYIKDIEKKNVLRLSDGSDYPYLYYEQQRVYEDTLSTEEEKIEIALTRIELDRSVFRTINHTLSSILRHIYAYIQQDYKNKVELEKRLLEELLDMAGTCSSGYISRLVNVLSGFGMHTFHISWEDQIKANLSGRLNALIRLSENKDELLEQMTSEGIGTKPAFLKFFRENISFIKEEMYNEFKEFMEDTDWDLYFKKAIIVYYT